MRSAYALAWLRKFKKETRLNPALSFSSSGHATLRLYSSRGRARGENHQANRAAITASAYAHDRGKRSTRDCTTLNALHVHSPMPQRLNIGRNAYQMSARSLIKVWNRSATGRMGFSFVPASAPSDGG